MMKYFCSQQSIEGLMIDVRRKPNKVSGIPDEWQFQHEITDKIPDRKRNVNENKKRKRLKVVIYGNKNEWSNQRVCIR